ncbi:hypothetical protein F3Y22_tig00111659pilonHSYRG00147 [Hibiscus syriacus]|uniref:Uncharacterized protein n=1 Tax=Hibiscus syriacus TaxID=106335 RepID=A0A6A2XYS5_HIBSY|nr:hypothetical protein F3Y22_tig00111659pilonHSYRG00147 [Hibiscus syriacus]
MSPVEDLVISRLSSLKKELKHEEENRNQVRLMVKQVKQSVGCRKVGSDITNTVRKSSIKVQPVDELHKRQPPKAASRCNEKVQFTAEKARGAFHIDGLIEKDLAHCSGVRVRRGRDCGGVRGRDNGDAAAYGGGFWSTGSVENDERGIEDRARG